MNRHTASPVAPVRVAPDGALPPDHAIGCPTEPSWTPPEQAPCQMAGSFRRGLSSIVMAWEAVSVRSRGPARVPKSYSCTFSYSSETARMQEIQAAFWQ